MSVQAHKCNQIGCDGFILADNADYDYQESLKQDCGVLDRCKCNKCGKEFLMVVSHSLIEIDEVKHDLIDELPQCCYTEYEKSLKR